MFDLLKAQMGMLEDPSLKKVAALYDANLIKFVQICSQDWIISSFQNDVTLQTALLALYQMLQSQSQQQVKVDRNVKQ